MSIVYFLDAHAGAAEVFLAVVLIGVTLWYARSAKLQVEEARQARLTTLQPYVHVVGVAMSKNPDPMVRLNLTLRNLGSGPALSLRMIAIQPTIRFQLSLSQLDLGAHETIERPIDAQAFTTPAPGQDTNNQIGLCLEYR